MFREVTSGAKPDRAQLRRLLDQFDAVDVMMVTRLDRQRAAPRHVEHARGDHRQGAGFLSATPRPHDHGSRSLDADTGVERDLIRARTAEGRSRAQKRGQRMGRKPKLTEVQQKEARQRRAQGATLAELARSYGVGTSTISRL